MSLSTKECAWHQTTVKMLGATIVGIRGFEFNKNVEKEYLHAAGNEPIDIQTGNKTYPGSLTLLKYEVDRMNEAARAAGFEDYTEVPHEAVTITCVYRKQLTDKPSSVTCIGVAISALSASMQQNAKMTEVPLPFIAMKTVFA